jgi:general stress protein 26
MRQLSGTLVFTLGVCYVTHAAMAANATTGNYVDVLISEKGQPDSKQITNAEDHPLKGKIWTYTSGDSRQDYLIRDGKIRWLRETPDQSKAVVDASH